MGVIDSWQLPGAASRGWKVIAPAHSNTTFMLACVLPCSVSQRWWSNKCMKATTNCMRNKHKKKHFLSSPRLVVILEDVVVNSSCHEGGRERISTNWLTGRLTDWLIGKESCLDTVHARTHVRVTLYYLTETITQRQSHKIRWLTKLL